MYISKLKRTIIGTKDKNLIIFYRGLLKIKKVIFIIKNNIKNKISER